MISGTVKMWKEAEGWGFIEGDDGDDYFFNIANIRKGQKILINVGVKFDVHKDIEVRKQKMSVYSK